MASAATIDDLLDRMADMQWRLDRSCDGRRHWHGLYRRGTIAVREEIRRGGFADPDWIEQWELAFSGIYLEAMERWDRRETPAGPWQEAFEAARDPAIPPLRHVLMGLNAHINFDLPQALIAVISDAEFGDPRLMARRLADHRHAYNVLMVPAALAGQRIATAGRRGRSLADQFLVPVNQAGTRWFLREARAKVYANARLLSLARRQGQDTLTGRLVQLENLCRYRVNDLRAPGQVLIRLSVRGFGVALPD